MESGRLSEDVPANYGSTCPYTRVSSFAYPDVTSEEASRLFQEYRSDGAKWGPNSTSLRVDAGSSEETSRGWRLINRNGPFRQATGAIRVQRLNRSRGLYIMDVFHTLVDSPLRVVVGTFMLAYLATILVFAMGFMAVSAQCELGVEGFKGAWLFSLETIMTIGYSFPGKRDYFAQCDAVVVLITFESIIGVICDAIAVGLVYARFARAQTRASTIVFSDYAVVRRINHKLYFMFQVAEMRKHQLVEAHIRCYAVSRHRCSDRDGALFYFRTETMRLVKPDDELGGMLFMALPNIVVHGMDRFSPMYPRPATGASHDPSFSYVFPDVNQRDVDVENGSRECKTIAAQEQKAQLESGLEKKQLSGEEQALQDEEEEDMIRQYLDEHRVEIVVVLEGIDAVTSDTIQARHSYCAGDLKWHHDFVPCAMEGPDGEAILDFAHFHKVFPVPDEYKNHTPMYVFSNP